MREIVNGRELRTVAVDPDRAPLVQWMFEHYANGNVNLRDLLAEATDRGLTTRPTAKWVEGPLSLASAQRMLRHPCYKGLVRYNGVEYPGNHEPLVSVATWERLQEQLDARGRAGEKVRTHDHYLKGTVFCGE